MSSRPMPRFQPKKPIVTDRPLITVDAGLPPGKYRFRLVVEDRQGRQSAPEEAVVEIRPAQQPSAPGRRRRSTGGRRTSERSRPATSGDEGR